MQVCRTAPTASLTGAAASRLGGNRVPMAFVEWGLVALAAVGVLVATALALAAIGVARQLRVEARRRQHPGNGGLVGRMGVVRRPLDPAGTVSVDGELWNARRAWDLDDVTPDTGDKVVIESVEGLTLAVRPAEPWEIEP
jgi:membrane protein implicated in regulation of membrane protease activity